MASRPTDECLRQLDRWCAAHCPASREALRAAKVFPTKLRSKGARVRFWGCIPADPGSADVEEQYCGERSLREPGRWKTSEQRELSALSRSKACQGEPVWERVGRACTHAALQTIYTHTTPLHTQALPLTTLSYGAT